MNNCIAKLPSVRNGLMDEVRDLFGAGLIIAAYILK